jgi:ribosomal protein S18 acetylase RimI-like enzyme
VKTLQINIRDMCRDDIPALEVVLEQTALFPSELLRPMAEPWLSGRADHRWLVAIGQQHPIGFAYVEGERMSEGTFNLLAIAVKPEAQRCGVGKALVFDLMQRLRNDGGRVLLVETSSLDEFATTRAFYEGQAFTQEARIRDFYKEGEDKIVYWTRV